MLLLLRPPPSAALAMKPRSDLCLEDILPYLEGVQRSGSQITAQCPLCHKKGHLYITEKNGTLLAYCQRCNAKGTELFRHWRSLGAKPKKVEAMDYSKNKPIEDYRHEYKLPNGSISFYKRRRKWEDGHKVFSFAYRDQDGNVKYNKPPESPNLYNLDLLTQADATTTLYIVEGEKCADAMTKAGLLATTSCTGAQKTLKLTNVDREALAKFSSKVLIPDNDDKGQDYAAAWGKDVQILPMVNIWPECPRKGDVADFFERGGLVEAITGYQPLSKEYIESLDKYQLIDSDFLEKLASIKDESERQRFLSYAEYRAKDLRSARNFKNAWNACLRKQAAEYSGETSNWTNFEEQPLKLRCKSWLTDKERIWTKVVNSQGEKTVIVSAIPVLPVEIMVNTEDKREKVKLAIRKEGEWKFITVPRSQCASAAKIVDLADYGLEVTSDNAKLLVKYLADVITDNPDLLPRIKSTSHMGWHDEDFIPYDHGVVLDIESQYQSLVEAVHTQNSLEEWTKYMQPLRENLYLRLTMAASFASVLIERTNALPFVFHLWGGTGSGKTVGLMVAASIWGKPNLGSMVRTMNMTVNSMMTTAAVLRNLPFFGDELQTIKSKYENYDTLVMRVCEGIDRGRMTNAVFQRQKTWANAFIFTGEEPCTKSDSGGGVKNRVLEIECNAAVVKDGNAVVGFINKHYGCAGPAYISYIQSKGDAYLQEQYRELQSFILENSNTTEKQASNMALLMLADMLAAECLWPDEGVDKTLNLEKLFGLLVKTEEVDSSERAYRALLDLLAEHTDKFTDYSSLPKTMWGRIDSGRIVIIKSVLERELTRLGFEFAAVKKKWANKGYLIRNSQGRYYGCYSVNNVKGNYVIIATPKAPVL